CRGAWARGSSGAPAIPLRAAAKACACRHRRFPARLRCAWSRRCAPFARLRCASPASRRLSMIGWRLSPRRSPAGGNPKSTWRSSSRACRGCAKATVTRMTTVSRISSASWLRVAPVAGAVCIQDALEIRDTVVMRVTVAFAQPRQARELERQVDLGLPPAGERLGDKRQPIIDSLLLAGEAQRRRAKGAQRRDQAQRKRAGNRRCLQAHAFAAARSGIAGAPLEPRAQAPRQDGG